MTDPVFGTAFFVGILGNLLARHVDPAQQSAAEAIFARLTSGKPDLPPNHDVARACRISLRQALELMAQTMDLHVTEPKTLAEAFKNRFDAQGRWKPMLDWWHTEEKNWFVEFTDAIASEETLASFDLDWVKGASSLSDALRTGNNADLAKHFADALLAWTARHVQQGKRPGFFDQWVREGWPVAHNSPTVRISFYSAWCLFLQDHFKNDEKVRAILTADWLGSIDERVHKLNLTSQDICSPLQQALGEQLKMLTELRDQVQVLAANFAGLEQRSGQLFALVLKFRGEVGVGFSSVRVLLAQQHAEVRQKLDTSLQNDTRILDKLDQVLANQATIPAAITVPTSPVSKRIADSKLLDSDGAARIPKLIGRAQEKGLLTRAWHDEKLRVLSFVAWGGSGKTSIIIDWIRDHLKRHWNGVDAFFDWSFYSQGTRDQASASSDAFFSAALRHFGEDTTADSAKSIEEKAERLAMAMKKQKTLLVLDGIEPLQHPRKPGQIEGRLKDNGILKLLRLLAKSEVPGLCLITTRVPVVDLQQYHDISVQEVPLNHLSVRHGAALLHLAGARFAGAAPIEPEDKELLAAVKEVKGHAMTLQMLGGYLRQAQDGDIRRRDRVDFKKAFDDQLEGHTYNVMEAYEQWFQAEGVRGRRQLAVLRMLGLFDRVADAGCIAALRKDDGVTGVSDAVAVNALPEGDWQETLTHLSDHRLVFVDRNTHSLDAHPLLREYFSRQLRTQQPDAWRAAHRRLYEHLCATTKEDDQPTLEDLQPLYQAVAHGCQAGLQQEVIQKVYYSRILHVKGRKLGAFGSDLGAVACFFEQPWSRVSVALTEIWQAWLLTDTAFRLRAVGRLTEAIEPMRAGSEIAKRASETASDEPMRLYQSNEAARRASNLSGLELTLGKVAEAVMDAEQSVTYADRTGDAYQSGTKRETLADALHQAGRRAEAETRFREAEQIQAKNEPQPLLYSTGGFRYCDLLLAAPERAAWQLICLGGAGRLPVLPQLLESCRAVSQRAAQTLKIAERLGLLDIALDHLTLGRAALCEAILEGRVGNPLPAADNPSRSDAERPARSDVPHLETAFRELDAAVDGLRRAGTTHWIPAGLLTRAWLRFLTGGRTGPESAQDLDEAWEIAERGPMKLFLADIHLYRARLFGRQRAEGRGQKSECSEEKYPWESPAADLAAAEKLINECGYHRRDEELADAKRAILGSP